MLQKLQKQLDFRLTLTIAAGILGGVFAYRLLAATFKWAMLGWIELTEMEQAELRFTCSIVLFVGICASASLIVRALIRKLKIIRSQRAVEAAELKKQQQTLLNIEALNRQTKLGKFIKWMRIAEDQGIGYLTPDSEMQDFHSQRVLESLRSKSTEELLDIVVQDDYNEWSEVARTLARQIILYRSKSPEFAQALDGFKKSYVPHLVAHF